jgi:ferritin-like metal-binding protein YciE
MASSSSSSPSKKEQGGELQHEKGSEKKSRPAAATAAAAGGGADNTPVVKSREDRFLLYLNMMLSIENAAVERLHARIQESQIPEVKGMLVKHLEETREQKDRLADIIRDIGSGRQGQPSSSPHSRVLATPTDERAGLPEYQPPGILADALEASSTPMERELKTIEIDWLIENAEVMGYMTLVQMAQKMGLGDALVALMQSLDEEERVDKGQQPRDVWAVLGPAGNRVETRVHGCLKAGRGTFAAAIPIRRLATAWIGFIA